MKKALYPIMIGLVGILFSGCGGGGGGSSSVTPETKTGYLIDTAVRGIDYKDSSGKSGKTGIDGAFTYTVGSNVIFSLGGLELGTISSVNEDEIVTLQDLAGVARTAYDDEKVLLIGQLLQSLDSDNNLSNGIEITQTHHDKVAEWLLETSVSKNIQNLTASNVQNLVESKIEKTFITSAVAKEHLRTELLKINQKANEDSLYIFQKDENNSLTIEKYLNNGMVLTKKENGIYTSSKILLDGVQNPIGIEYATDGLLMSYNGTSEKVLYEEESQDTEVTSIPSKYIGIWREDEDGDIDIAYVYENGVVVFSANTDDFGCTQSQVLTPSQFASLLQNSIDIEDYIKDTQNANLIQSKCGSYSSHTISRAVSRSFFMSDLAENEDDSLESATDKTISTFWKMPLELFKSQPVGIVFDKISAWAITKFQAKTEQIENIGVKIKDNLNRLNQFVEMRSSDNQTYSNVMETYDNNEISTLVSDINSFENNEDITGTNQLKNTKFIYEKPNEKGDMKTTQVIYYNEENKKVQEIPSYDENGSVISVSIRTNFDSSGGYDETNETGVIDDTNESETQNPDLLLPVNTSKFIIDGNIYQATNGSYTRLTKFSTYKKLYIENILDSNENSEIVNSLNEIDFIVDDQYKSDGKWLAFEDINISSNKILPKFWANYGDGSSYSTCYNTSINLFQMSYGQNGVNEYSQPQYKLNVKYKFTINPVSNPNSFCQAKDLQSFTQEGEVEINLGTYWQD
jgi:hypothetical protein